MKKLRLLQYAAWLCLLLPLPTLAEVKLPDGQWTERHVDLKVKVLGGFVQIDRQWINNRWYLNPAWADLRFIADPLDQSVKAVDRAGVLYERMAFGGTGGGSVYVYDNSVFIRADGNGWRWYDRFGNWITYDQKGRITAYGDRNDIKVTFERDGGGHLATVKDHNGEVALTLQWEGERISSVTDRAQRKVQYRYEGSRLTQVIDVLNYTWQWGYDSNGQITSRTDPESRTTTVTYAESTPAAPASLGFGFAPNSAATGSGSVTTGYTPRDVKLARVQKVTDAAKQETSYSYDYDRVKRLFTTEIVDVGRRVTRMTHDLNGRLLMRELGGRTLFQQTVEKGRQITWDERGLPRVETLDSSGNSIRQVFPDGASISFSYSPNFQQPLEYINELGVKTKYQYDSRGNLLQRDEAFGKPEQRTTIYTYTPLGQVATATVKGATVADDIVRSYTYDRYGNLKTEIDPENYVTEYEYDVMGSAILVKDSRQNAWRHVFNEAGWLLSKQNPLGNQTRYEYDRTGHRTKFINARGGETSYEYDKLYRLARLTMPNGGSQSYEYSPTGNQTRMTDADGVTTEYEYDEFGRRVTEKSTAGPTTKYVYGDAQSGNAGLLVAVETGDLREEYKYDTRHRQVEITQRSSGKVVSKINKYDAAGQLQEVTIDGTIVRKYVYDGLGRYTSVTELGGTSFAYKYDVQGNVIEIIDGKQSAVRYRYDKKRRRIEDKLPMGEVTRYEYPLDGGRVRRISAMGQVIETDYDAAGRVAAERHFAANGVVTRTISFTHYPTGDLSGYVDQVGAQANFSGTYEVDAVGHLTRMTVDWGAVKKTFQQAFTPGGRLQKKIYPGGQELQYQHEDGYLRKIQLSGGEALALAYDQGNVSLLSGFNTVQTVRRGPFGRMQKVTVQQVGTGTLIAPTGEKLLEWELEWNARGNLALKRTEHGIYSFSYDDADRLATAVMPVGAGLDNESYRYDAVHNRVSSADSVGDWTYNANHQLLQFSDAFGELTFGYNSNGQTTSEQRTASGRVTRKELIYHDNGRLAAVKIDGALVGSYRYDPFERRISKTANGKTIYFLYSGEGLIGEYDEGGAVIREYAWLPSTQWMKTPLFVMYPDGGKTKSYWAITDHLGTVSILIDKQGKVAWVGRYSAFGKLKAATSDSALELPLRLPGQYFDVESGLHQNWHRDYSTNTGRYMTVDPLGFHVGGNGYAYAEMNPIMRSDPLGLESSECCKATRLSQADCCQRASAEIKEDKARASVVCCGTRAELCVLDPKDNPLQGYGPKGQEFAYGSEVMEVITECARQHEKKHLDAHPNDCSKCREEESVRRARFPAGVNADLMECEAWQVDVDCMSGKVSTCVTSQCRKQLSYFIYNSVELVNTPPTWINGRRSGGYACGISNPYKKVPNLGF